MNRNELISLPIPPPATRQVGVGSPIELSRGDSLSPEDLLRQRLVVYKVYLEHDLQFIDSEIQALIARPSSNNHQEQAAFLDLRSGLKIRYNTLSTRLARVKALLDVI